MKKLLVLTLVFLFAMSAFATPEDGAFIDLHTEYQTWFLTLDRTSLTRQDMEDIYWKTQKRQERSRPEPIVFTWDGEGGVFELSEDAEFSAPRIIECRSSRAEVNNLKLGTTYYWRVDGGEAHSFTTSSVPPRFLSVEGVSNVRDLGGYKTDDDGIIRQGMIIRGAALNEKGNSFSTYASRAGKKTLTEELGIRTDLDLRGDAPDTVSPLESVNYLKVGLSSYGTFYLYNRTELVTIMNLLADESNYPVYIHCQGGADRTGCLCAAILTYLGVSEEDVLTDYELTTISAVGNRSRHDDNPKNQNKFDYLWYTGWASRPGETYKEKVTEWFLARGVTQETLDKVRSILVDYEGPVF